MWSSPTPGFPCDRCGGKHPKTYSCKTCGAWVCASHVVIVSKDRQYELPEKTAYCKSCDPSKADR